jgi:hypothetical protein
VTRALLIVIDLTLKARYYKMIPYPDKIYWNCLGNNTNCADHAPIVTSAWNSDISDELDQGWSPMLAPMGIAAGGKLIQDIYVDTNPRHIWNKPRTRLVNVHILDSFTFETITHIVPPPTPITAKAYNDQGFHVFLLEEEVDGRLDSGNPLKGVKSVSMIDKETGIDGISEATFDPLKPKKCQTCELRLCDCMYVLIATKPESIGLVLRDNSSVRPCNHQFCNLCIKQLQSQRGIGSTSEWKCPTCLTRVSHVAGFSAPMNLPREEAFKVDVPVVMLKIDDGRVAFDSIVKMRM